MLKKYKNALFENVRANGFDVSFFTGMDTTTDRGAGFVVEFRGTPLKFTIIEPVETYHQFIYRFVGFTPGYKERNGDASGAFGYIAGEFNRWLTTDVRGYIEENSLPDPWAEMQSVSLLNIDSSISAQDYEPFTEQEKLQIRNGIAFFEQRVILQFQPSLEEQAFIHERLDYLSQRVDRLNRFDWRGVVIAVLITIIGNLTLDTERGKMLFQLFEQAMQNAIHLLK